MIQSTEDPALWGEARNEESKREKESASSSAPGKFPNPEDSLWSLGNVLPPGNYVILVGVLEYTKNITPGGGG